MAGEINQEQLAEVETLVRQIWHQDVIETINDVLDADHYLGFKHFEAYADPSIDDIANSLNLIDAMLLVILGHKAITDEVESLLLNCQQCVHLIRRVVSGLKRDDEADYSDAVAKLKCHVGQERRRHAEMKERENGVGP